MKTVKIRTLFLSMFALICFNSCDSDSDSDDSSRNIVETLLENVVYLKVADEDQPAWLQSLIEKNPYLKVLRSEKGSGNYILQAPQKGNEVSVYDKDGKELFVSANREQLQQIVQDGQPWMLTHIYSFPMKPGDAEWDFSRYSVAEIKEKLQLPAALLGRMTTSDLIETCIDYPYYFDFIFYEDKQRGMECLRQEFNGIDELLKRKDLAGAMLRKYEMKIQMTEEMSTRESLEQGAFSNHFRFFKMLLAQDEVLNQLSRENLRQLITLSYEANNQVSRYDMFGSIHYEPSFFLFSRIIVREKGFPFASNEEQQTLEYFAQTCTVSIAVFTEDLQQRIYSYLMNL